MQQWTIWNNYPAGAPKFWAFPSAVFGLRASGKAVALQTMPPTGIDGIAALRYSGAYPVSRLVVDDPTVPVAASLFGYSRYVVGDMARSSTPAVAFSLVVRNTGAATTDIDFSLVLPFSVEPESSRPAAAGTLLSTAPAASPEACLAQCEANIQCASWNLDAEGACMLSSTVAHNRYSAGSASGVRGEWSAEPSANGGACLTLTRPGVGPAQGTLSACADGDDTAVSVGTAASIAGAWAPFANTGGAPPTISPADAYGMLSARVSAVPPGETRAITIVLGWNYPERYYLSQRVGNHYATDFNSSAAAARSLADDLLPTISHISALHAVFFDATSLPDWLSDTLINMLSHVRSAWWEEDGEWRQWEAYDCVNVDSVHNDGERHLPYLTIFPNSTRDKLHAWGRTQQANGMIPEQLACGCTAAIDAHLDRGCGRAMSDVSSMYIVYLLELYRWANDTATLAQLWPVAKRAAQWQMNVSAADGAPTKLCNTYDILGPERHEHVSYNTVFHLLAMAAASQLATAVGDATFAAACTKALARGQAALDAQQWVEATNTTNNASAHYSFAVELPDSLMADSLYGQVLASSVGLGTIVSSAEKIRLHLTTEAEWNDSPDGLRVESTAGRSSGAGVAVWQGASPNWAYLNIAGDGTTSFMPVEAALEQPAKSLGLWRSRLNDLWNICGLSQDGQPWITSHYGFAMTAWHLPYALSGQHADLPRGELTFTPKVDTSASWALPWYLPGVLGTLNGTADGRFTYAVRIGHIVLKRLAVGGSAYPGPVALGAGEAVSWS